MASQTGEATPASSASSSATRSLALTTIQPTVTFTSLIPDQLDTCTYQFVSWTSTGILNNTESGSDNNSTGTGTTIEDTYPLSVILVGIAGFYTPPQASNMKNGTPNISSSSPSSILMRVLFEAPVGYTIPETNFTYSPVDVPAGIYNFFASLQVLEQVNTESQDGEDDLALLVEVETFNFTSKAFEVRDMGCVVYPELSNASSSTPLSILPNPDTNFGSAGTSSSATGAHRSAGAIAGITVGAISGAVILFSLISLLLRRSRRSRTRTWWAHRIALSSSNSRRLSSYSSKGYSKGIETGWRDDSGGRKGMSSSDFIGLQNLDDAVRLPTSPVVPST